MESMLDPKTRYNYLVEARKHHTSQFHVWMLFFVVINGGLLVAYTQGNAENMGHAEKGLILAVGYAAALLFHCSAKGYKYWNTSFTALINDCERKNIPDKHDRVYACFADISENNSILCPLKGANISTSKLVSVFAYILTYGWGTLIVVFLCKCFKSGFLCELFFYNCEAVAGVLTSPPLFVEIVFAIIATTVVNIFCLLLAGKCLKSNMKGLDDLNLKDENAKE